MRKLLFALLLAFGFMSASALAADQCAPIKAKAECGKKAGCAWNGKACAAKAAPKAQAAKPGKPGKATAAKPGKPAAKKPEAKPEPAPAPTPAEPPLDEELPAGDGEAEDF
jgi:hypothetical protein